MAPIKLSIDIATRLNAIPLAPAKTAN